VNASLPSAGGTAEVLAARFHALADDGHFAVIATRREHLNRTLERVERVRRPANGDFKRFVVGVAARLAGFHARCELQAVSL
jgi:hypothetical protein